MTARIGMGVLKKESKRNAAKFDVKVLTALLHTRDPTRYNSNSNEPMRRNVQTSMGFATVNERSI